MVYIERFGVVAILLIALAAAVVQADVRAPIVQLESSCAD